MLFIFNVPVEFAIIFPLFSFYSHNIISMFKVIYMFIQTHSIHIDISLQQCKPFTIVIVKA